MMLRILLHVLFIIFLFHQLNAQETATKNRKYKTWVKKTDSKSRLVGVLYQVEDTKLLISNSFEHEVYDLNQFEYQDVYAYEIEKIKLRRKGSIGRGILIGVASGFVTGAIIGFVNGDEPCHPTCFIGGSAEDLGLIGGVVGAVVGSLKISIPINGSESKFRYNLPGLKSYAYQK